MSWHQTKDTFFSIFSRPSYVIPKKEQIRSRKLSGPRTKAPRALSPINYKVKEYLARADEKIEDYLERIVQNVDSAQFMVKSCVQKLRDWKGIFLCWHKKQSYLKWLFLVNITVKLFILKRFILERFGDFF